MVGAPVSRIIGTVRLPSPKVASITIEPPTSRYGTVTGSGPSTVVSARASRPASCSARETQMIAPMSPTAMATMSTGTA